MNATTNAATRRDIDRVFEIWRDALDRSGGPFLFGRFSIAGATFYPVRTRLRTYGVAIPEDLGGYVQALDDLPAVRALHDIARSARSAGLRRVPARARRRSERRAVKRA